VTQPTSEDSSGACSPGEAPRRPEPNLTEASLGVLWKPMWKFIKAVFVSWLIGVICGVGLVLTLQHEVGTAPSPATSASKSAADRAAAGP
jgi:hypothetical protein